MSSAVESSQAQSGTAGTGMKDGKTMDDFMAAMNELYSELTLTPIDDDMLKELLDKKYLEPGKEEGTYYATDEGLDFSESLP